MEIAATSRVGASLLACVAVALGVLTLDSPHLAVAALLALGFIVLVAHDAAAGVAAFCILALIEQIPPITGSPAIKLAGGVLVVSLIAKQLSLLRILRERPIIACTAIFLATWAGVSCLWAEDVSVAVNSAMRLALGVILLFVVYGAIRERRHVRWLAYAFVSGAFITSLIGLATTPSVDSTRLAGAVGNPNELGSILVPALALGGFALVSSQRFGTRMLVSASLAGMLLALLATGSRGALVALGISLIVAAVFGGSYRLHVTVSIAIIIGLGVGYYAVVAPSTVRDRVTDIGAEGGSGRTDLWKVASKASTDRPVLGSGAGNFPIVAPTYATATVDLPQYRFIVDTPLVAHNTYLGVQAELGVPGLIAFLLIVGGALTSSSRAIRTAHVAGERELEFLARGILVALVGFLAAAMFGSFEYEKTLWLLLGIAVAMPSVVSRSAGTTRA